MTPLPTPLHLPLSPHPAQHPLPAHLTYFRRALAFAVGRGTVPPPPLALRAQQASALPVEREPPQGARLRPSPWDVARGSTRSAPLALLTGRHVSRPRRHIASCRDSRLVGHGGATHLHGSLETTTSTSATTCRDHLPSALLRICLQSVLLKLGSRVPRRVSGPRRVRGGGGEFSPESWFRFGAGFVGGFRARVRPVAILRDHISLRGDLNGQKFIPNGYGDVPYVSSLLLPHLASREPVSHRPLTKL